MFDADRRPQLWRFYEFEILTWFLYWTVYNIVSPRERTEQWLRQATQGKRPKPITSTTKRQSWPCSKPSKPPLPTMRPTAIPMPPISPRASSIMEWWKRYCTFSAPTVTRYSITSADTSWLDGNNDWHYCNGSNVVGYPVRVHLYECEVTW